MKLRPAISLILSQKLAEMSGVAMAVAELPHPRRLAAEMHAGVIEAIGEHQRLVAEHGAVEQRLQHGGVGLEARGHHQRGGLMLETRDLGLDRHERVEIAGDEARRARAHAVSLGPVLRPVNQGGVEAETEIIVAGEIDVGPPFDADLPRLRGSDRRQ